MIATRIAEFPAREVARSSMNELNGAAFKEVE